MVFVDIIYEGFLLLQIHLLSLFLFSTSGRDSSHLHDQGRKEREYARQNTFVCSSNIARSGYLYAHYNCTRCLQNE